MSKMLAKVLKDAAREKRIIVGARQVLKAAADSNLVVLSNSDDFEDIVEATQKDGVPTLQFDGTSVALGKLCGIQFRVSALSLNGVDGSIVQSVIKENESPAQGVVA